MEMEVNKKLLKQLPIELIYHIQKYSYNIQNKDLLVDLTHFLTTKELLYTYYFNYWLSIDSDSDFKYYILCDLIGYACNNKTLAFGFNEHFYNIFLKNFSLNNKNKVDKYLVYFDKCTQDSQINILLGLFTKNERNEFMKSKNIQF
jgi:hypothetical protein